MHSFGRRLKTHGTAILFLGLRHLPSEEGLHRSYILFSRSRQRSRMEVCFHGRDRRKGTSRERPLPRTWSEAAGWLSCGILAPNIQPGCDLVCIRCENECNTYMLQAPRLAQRAPKAVLTKRSQCAALPALTETTLSRRDGPSRPEFSCQVLVSRGGVSIPHNHICQERRKRHSSEANQRHHVLEGRACPDTCSCIPEISVFEECRFRGNFPESPSARQGRPGPAIWGCKPSFLG